MQVLGQVVVEGFGVVSEGSVVSSSFSVLGSVLASSSVSLFFLLEAAGHTHHGGIVVGSTVLLAIASATNWSSAFFLS